jgi:hypothetical protein
VTRIENGDSGRMRGAQVQWSRRFEAGAGRIDPSVSNTCSAWTHAPERSCEAPRSG